MELLEFVVSIIGATAGAALAGPGPLGSIALLVLLLILDQEGLTRQEMVDGVRTAWLVWLFFSPLLALSVTFREGR